MACRVPAGCTELRDAAIDPLRQPGRGPSRARSFGAPPLDGVADEGLGSRRRAPSGRQPGGEASASVAARRLGGGRAAPAFGETPQDGGMVGRAGWLNGRLPRVRPLKALTVVAFAVSLVGILANAMVFQRGRQAGPLFGLGRSIDGQADAAPPRAVAPPPAAPSVLMGPAERTGAISAPMASPPVPQAAPAKPAVTLPAAPKPHRSDPVAAAPGDGGPSKPRAVAEHHPRPGHAAKPVPRTAADPSDPVAKLLARTAHPPKAEPVEAARPAAAVHPAALRQPAAAGTANGPSASAEPPAHVPVPHSRPKPHHASAEVGKPPAKAD